MFTQTGNNTIKPILEKKIESRIKQDINIEKFTLKTDYIELKILLNQNSSLHVKGNFSLFSKLFNINIIAQNLKIEEALTLAKQPIYSQGLLNIKANIFSTQKGNYDGISDIKIQNASFNNRLLEKDFGIKFNKIVTYDGTIKTKLDKNTLHVTSKIDSNIANLKTTKTTYNLNDKSLYSDYILGLPDLSDFEKILAIPIQGTLHVKGDIKKNKDTLSLKANSKSLDGNINILTQNDTIKADFTDIDLQKLQTMFKKTNQSDGKLDLHVELKNTNSEQKKGKILLNIKDGILHVKQEKKKTKDIKYTLKSQSFIQNNIASFDVDLVSNIAKFNLQNSSFDIKNRTLKGLYTLHVEDLNKLYFLTEHKLRGNCKIGGNYIYKENIYIDGKSAFLDAKTNFTLKNNIFTLKSEKLKTTNLTYMLYYPKVFDSYSSLDINYDLLEQNGTANLTALNGKLTKSALTDIIKSASRYDLTKEVFKNTLLNTKINKQNIDFILLMNGKNSYIKMPSGHFNTKNKKINSKFEIKISKKDFQGKIKGTINKPRIKLDNSVYLKKKINKEIEKNIPKEWQGVAKSLLKLFD